MENNALTTPSALKAPYRTALALAIIGLAATVTPMSAFAHVAVGGSSSGANVVVTDSVLWTTLRSVPVNFTGETGINHNCAVTASSSALNPGGNAVEQKYVFAISLDTLAPSEAVPNARVLELRNQGDVDDPDVKPVATTEVFFNVSPASHTIFWLAKKLSDSATAPNLTVDSSSISITCVPSAAF